MKTIFFLVIMLLGFISVGQKVQSDYVNSTTYLSELKMELQIEWPENRTLNIVFHGHSVPAGYFKTPLLNMHVPYPSLLKQKIKMLYPYAVVDVIITAIDGED